MKILDKNFYRLAAIALALMIAGTLLDIVLGMSLGTDLSALPQTAEARFAQLNQNAWLGLYNLDFLNLCTACLLIPAFAAMAGTTAAEAPGLSLLSLLLFAVGSAAFVSQNAALPLLQLAHEFGQAPEPRRALLLGAGEALLARGAHGSLGAFPGFALLTLANLGLAWAMLQSKAFGRATGLFGAAGSLLLLGYLAGVTLVPGAGKLALALAAPGGLLTLAWLSLSAVTIFKLAGAGKKAG